MTVSLVKDDGTLLPIQGTGRPTRYKLHDGTIVPGVTSITGRFKEAGGLMHWAWQQGMDGKDYRDTRDEAADIGKQAHALIDAAIHGRPAFADAADVPVAAADAFRAFENWRAQTKIDLVATETPLVSQIHRFGGTPDALGTIDGRMVLLDWKSSNAVHPEYLAQIGGYVLLVEENLELGPVQEVHLLRVGKEDASWHHHAWTRGTLERAAATFIRMRALYDDLAVLKKATA